MSSKRAAAQGSKEFFIDILRVLAQSNGVNPDKIASILEQKYYARPAAKLWYMERRGYVKRTGNQYMLTQRGKTILSERELWETAIPIPKHWDGKWHFVMFDIPTDKRKRRDVFRLHMKRLGLVLYQNSVWVHPYPCEEVVRRVSDFYHLSKCVSFAIVEKFTGEKHIYNRFELS